MKLKYPLSPVVITQKFGVNGEWYQEHGVNIKGHNGVDFSCAHGHHILAAHDGIVTYVGGDAKEGVGVVIVSKDTMEYEGKQVKYKTIYWHLVSIETCRFKVGQEVKAGEIIGYGDNTGLSTGNHLHFGLKPVRQGEQDWEFINLDQNNGYMGAIDPMPYFELAKPSGMLTQTMKLGSSGGDVAFLQDCLRYLGYFPLTIPSTGYFGPVTANAVKSFQLKNFLFPDKIVGKKTREALNKKIK